MGDDLPDTGMDSDVGSALVGQVIAGKYYLEQYLGSGSTGAVYRARHSVLEKPVALKILDPALAHSSAMVEMFKREAKAASRLDHPNSVRVVDFGADSFDVLYIVMELVEGPNLQQVLDDEGPLGEARVIEIMCQILGALAKAHELGVVHRDLKPENVLLLSTFSDDGQASDLVKVCDFGVAQLSPLALPADPLPRVGPRHPTVIDADILVGTPEFMSPEQARGEALDARSDVYAAGVVMFQLLTQQLPFTADDASDVAMLQCYAPVPRPSSITPVSATLEAICLKALRKDPAQRYQSAREMRLDLRHAAAERATTLRPKIASSPAPRVGFAVATAGADHALAGAGVVAQSADGPSAPIAPSPVADRMLDVDTMSPPAATSVRPRAPSSRRPALALAVVSTLAPAAAAALLLSPRDVLETFARLRQGYTKAAQASSIATPQPVAVETPRPLLQPAVEVQAALRPAVEAQAPSLLEPAAAGLVLAATSSAAAAAPASERYIAHRSSKRAHAAARRVPESVADAGPLAETALVASVAPELPVTDVMRVMPREAAAAPAQAIPPEAKAPRAVLSQAVSPEAVPPAVAVGRPATVAPQPSKPSPPLRAVESVVAPSEPLQARTRIAGLDVQGSLATSVVERAIERLRPQLSECYARSARAAHRNGFGQVVVNIDFDERGRVRRARASGGELPGLDSCIGAAATRAVTVQAPDTGTLKATWRVAFER